MSRHIAVFLLVISAIRIGDFVGAVKEADIEVPNENAKTAPSLSAPVPTVECYACVNCPNAEGQSIKTCSYHPEASKVKKCVTYAEKYPHVINNKDISWVIRGCASERGSCADIKKAYSDTSPDSVQLEYCNECQGDKCNGVPRSLPDMVFAFYVVVLTPMLARYTLS